MLQRGQKKGTEWKREHGKKPVRGPTARSFITGRITFGEDQPLTPETDIAIIDLYRRKAKHTVTGEVRLQGLLCASQNLTQNIERSWTQKLDTEAGYRSWIQKLDTEAAHRISYPSPPPHRPSPDPHEFLTM